MTNRDENPGGLRQAVLFACVANLAYFIVEFTVALRIGSVSLFADSIDFLEDAALNLLIVIALAWSIRNRARIGLLLAALMVVPAVFTLWTAWDKFRVPSPPEPWLLSATGMGALVVNLACAFLLARYRRHESSLSRAAYLSARNDAFANVAIIISGAATLLTLSGWPDLLVGLGIAAMNADAGIKVSNAARGELGQAQA